MDKGTGTEYLQILLCVFHESIKGMSREGKMKWREKTVYLVLIHQN